MSMNPRNVSSLRGCLMYVDDIELDVSLAQNPQRAA